MPCPAGYIEINGKCEVNYLPGDANLDGTPNTAADGGNNGGGNFWDKLGNAAQQYGPLILIGTGTWWQSKQTTPAPTQNTNTDGTPVAPAKTGVPVWVWIGGGVVVLVIIVLLVRRTPAAIVRA